MELRTAEKRIAPIFFRQDIPAAASRELDLVVSGRISRYRSGVAAEDRVVDG